MLLPYFGKVYLTLCTLGVDNYIVIALTSSNLVSHVCTQYITIRIASLYIVQRNLQCTLVNGLQKKHSMYSVSVRLYTTYCKF